MADEEEIEVSDDVMAQVEASRAAGPARTGRPEGREHRDAARPTTGDDLARLASQHADLADRDTMADAWGRGSVMTDGEDETRALSTLDEVREAAMQLGIDERADVLVALLDTLGEEHQDLLQRATESEIVRRAYRRRGQEPDA